MKDPSTSESPLPRRQTEGVTGIPWMIFEIVEW